MSKLVRKVSPEFDGVNIHRGHVASGFTGINMKKDDESSRKSVLTSIKCPVSMSANFLRVIGGKSHLKASSKREEILNHLVRFFTCALFICMMCLHIYFIVINKSESQTYASIIIITTNFISCSMITIGTISGERVREMLIQIFNQIPVNHASLVAKYDRKRNIANLILGVTHIICLILYINHYGLHEMQSLLIGRVIYRDNSIHAYCITIFGIIAYRFSFLVILAAAQYYIAIQYVGFLYAEHCSLYFTRINSSSSKKFIHPTIINEMRHKIEFYNTFQLCINENIGFIPFAMLSLVWVVVTLGISSIAMKESIFQLAFGFITVGFAIVCISCQIYWITITAGKSTRSMERSRAIAARIVTFTNIASNITQMNDCSFKLSPEAVSLAHYLAIDPLVKAEAWSMIEISPFLLLAFCNAVIPFTIMIITTNREFSD